MSISDLGSLGEFIAAIGTLITLIYVAVEIHQNTRAVRAAAFQDVTGATSDWSAMLSQDDALLTVWLKATKEGLDPLSEFERAKYGFSILTLLRRAESIHYQETSGTLAREAWQGVHRSLEELIRIPAVHDWWEENAYRFRPLFQEYVESVFLY